MIKKSLEKLREVLKYLDKSYINILDYIWMKI